MGARLFINLTQVDMVYKNFGKKNQTGLPDMSLKEAEGYLKKGEFSEGSMKPKIEAAVEFLKGGGVEVIITTPELLDMALSGRAGTRIVA